jgi:hypothetical protein
MRVPNEWRNVLQLTVEMSLRHEKDQGCPAFAVEAALTE